MTYEQVLSLNVNEQINLAIESNDKNILEILSTSKMPNVRRALSKNNSISSKIADTLVFDPVLNVSYIANQNPNCTQTRDFKDIVLTQCIICDKDERNMNCSSCSFS